MEEVWNMMNDIPGMTLGRFQSQSEAGNDEQASAPQFNSFKIGVDILQEGRWMV